MKAGGKRNREERKRGKSGENGNSIRKSLDAQASRTRTRESEIKPLRKDLWQMNILIGEQWAPAIELHKQIRFVSIKSANSSVFFICIAAKTVHFFGRLKNWMFSPFHGIEHYRYVTHRLQYPFYNIFFLLIDCKKELSAHDLFRSILSLVMLGCIHMASSSIYYPNIPNIFAFRINCRWSQTIDCRPT